MLEQSIYKYSLQDVEEPNLYREMFNYEEVPKLAFNQRRVPMNMPEDVWITDTSFRDGAAIHGALYSQADCRSLQAFGKTGRFLWADPAVGVLYLYEERPAMPSISVCLWVTRSRRSRPGSARRRRTSRCQGARHQGDRHFWFPAAITIFSKK